MEIILKNICFYLSQIFAFDFFIGSIGFIDIFDLIDW